MKDTGDTQSGEATRVQGRTDWPANRSGPGYEPWLALTGAAMVLAAFALAILSLTANAGMTTTSAREALATWGVLAGAAYVGGLGFANRVQRAPDSASVKGRAGRRLAWVVAVGLIMRVSVLFTPSFLEDDFFRYLWDGAVVANGGNPYLDSPVAAGEPDSFAASAGLLDDEGETVRSRINHPHLTTVYGPAAQAGFALAHWVSPWKVIGLRGVWLVFDVMTMVALLALLRTLRAPAIWSAWYWWNPLLLREIFSSAHMDIMVLPLVLATMLLAIRQRPMLACLALAVAAAVKIWPVVLLPLALRAAGPSRRRAFAGMGLFVLASVLMWTPAFAAASDESSGLRTYARRWYNNDLVFRMVSRTVDWTIAQAQIEPSHGPHIARFVVGGLLAGFVILQTVKLSSSAQDLVRRSAMVVAALFILSPTQFPWYYLWMLPLLATSPQPALLVYTVTLPLYYAHYDHPWVVWVEHVPILIWLAIDAAAVRAGSLHHGVLLKVG